MSAGSGGTALCAPSGFCAQQLTISSRFTIAACVRFRAKDLPLNMTASAFRPFARAWDAGLYNAGAIIAKVRSCEVGVFARVAAIRKQPCLPKTAYLSKRQTSSFSVSFPGADYYRL